MVGIVWIPATTTSFLCLRQFVWWESPGVHCRGFFVCGYGRGVLLLDLFPPRNRTEEQRNACAHHISRRAQAHAGPARERRGRRAARREGPARRGRRHRPGAPVREGGMDRCARCGERGRPYDRLGVRRWRHLDIGCARLLLEHAPRRVDCAEHGVTVAMVPWRDARARTCVTSSGRSHG